MAFKADQPRIPKGFVGAGRFMKVGQALIAVAKDASNPGDGSGRGRAGSRLANAGSKLSRRDEAVERTFAGAARASKAAAPKAPRAKKADVIEGAFGRTASRALFPEDEGKGLSRRTDVDREAFQRELDAENAAVRAAKLASGQTGTGRRRKMSDAVHEGAYGPGVSKALFGEHGGDDMLKRQDAARQAAIKSTVRDSVARHETGGGWADIADVRDDLDAAGYTRAEQDEALKAMLADEPHFRVVPLADRKNLTRRDREAALVLGVDYNVAIRTTPGQFARRDDEPMFTGDDLRRDLAVREKRLADDAAAGLPEKALQDQREGIEQVRKQLADMEGTAKPKPKRGSLANAGAKLAQADGASTNSRVAALRAAETRADGEALLAGLRGAELKQIARQLSVDPNRPLAELRQAIVERTVGARINSRAVRGL